MNRLALLILWIAIVPLAAFAVIGDPGSRGVDWEAVKRKAAQYDWAKRAVEDMKRGVARTQRQFDHPPLGETGWLHEYFCGKDATHLTFDPDKPHEHVCPKCKTVYSGPPYDDCWRSTVHSLFAGAAENAAALYRVTGEREYLDFTAKTLLWYANNLDRFSPHGDHAGKGWVREQSLDEATQLVRLACAYWDVCKDLDAVQRETIATKFLIPDAEFIHKQTSTIHNIHSWHNAASGLVGLAVGDEQLAREAIDGKFGLNAQIERGVNDDGFWFEGSIGYHFYTVSSMQELFAAARAQGYPLKDPARFKSMYTAPIDFAFPNGQLPALNDCWYDQHLDRHAAYYEFAASRFDGEKIARALASMYKDQPRDSFEALLFGPETLPAPKPQQDDSVLFEASGVAILRDGGVNALLKYGPYGGGHDHLDRLNMLFFAKNQLIMPDLGTSGYGISLNQWYRSSAAHNMIVVDGQRQHPTGGNLISFEDGEIKANAGEVYPGVSLRRGLHVRDDGFDDVAAAESDDEHQYDLIYHVRGEQADAGGEWEDFVFKETSNGYPFLKNARILRNQNSISLKYTLREGGELTLECQTPGGADVIVGDCPDNPADLTMRFVIFRTHGKTAGWKVQAAVR